MTFAFLLMAGAGVFAQSGTNNNQSKPAAGQGTSGTTVPQGNRVKGTTEQSQGASTEATQSQGTSSQGTAAWPMSSGTTGSTTLPPESVTPGTTGEKQGTTIPGNKTSTTESQGTSSQGTAAWPQSSGTTGSVAQPQGSIQGNTTSPAGSENSSDMGTANSPKVLQKNDGTKMSPDSSRGKQNKMSPKNKGSRP